MAKRADIEAGSAFVRLYTKDQITGPMAKVSRQLKAFGAAASVVAGIVASAAAAIAAFGLAAVKHFAEAGSVIADMAARTGMSTEALSELAHVADLAGSSIEDLETAIKKMQDNLVKGSQGGKEMNKSLARLGVTSADLLKMKPEEQFERFAEAIAGISNPALQTAAAIDIFGKSGTKLLPFLKDGAKGLREAREEAKALGLTITPQMAANADKLGDAIDTLTKVLKGVVFQIGSLLAPAVTKALKGITSLIGAVNKLIRGFSLAEKTMNEFRPLVVSAMNDALSQMPDIAAYWLGRTVRTFADGFNQINAAWLELMAGMATGDPTRFLNKNPFFTGAGAFAAGFTNRGSPPGFDFSGATKAKYRDIEARILRESKDLRAKDSARTLEEIKKLQEKQAEYLRDLPAKLGELFPRFT